MGKLKMDKARSYEEDIQPAGWERCWDLNKHQRGKRTVSKCYFTAVKNICSPRGKPSERGALQMWISQETLLLELSNSNEGKYGQKTSHSTQIIYRQQTLTRREPLEGVSARVLAQCPGSIPSAHVAQNLPWLLPQDPMLSSDLPNTRPTHGTQRWVHAS